MGLEVGFVLTLWDTQLQMRRWWDGEQDWVPALTHARVLPSVRACLATQLISGLVYLGRVEKQQGRWVLLEEHSLSDLLGGGQADASKCIGSMDIS